MVCAVSNNEMPRSLLNRLPRGRKGGRKPVMDEKKLALASAMLKDREIPVREV
jgi:hypothetical protein